MPAPPLLTIATNYSRKLYEATPAESWLWSEKLDGWRAYWDGRHLRTRSGKLLWPPTWWAAGLPPQVALDGELYLGRGKLSELTGVLNSKPGGSKRYAEWDRVCFHVFDMPKGGGGYLERYQTLAELVNRTRRSSPRSPLRLVRQQRLGVGATPTSLAARVIAAGGEGIVLRSVHDAAESYVKGRSRGLLKLKGRADAEARVVQVERNNDGQLKALVVRCGRCVPLPRRSARQRLHWVDSNAVADFRLGTGFTLSQRSSHSFVKKDDIVTFQYNGMTSNGIPRDASYLRHRMCGDE